MSSDDSPGLLEMRRALTKRQLIYIDEFIDFVMTHKSIQTLINELQLEIG